MQSESMPLYGRPFATEDCAKWVCATFEGVYCGVEVDRLVVYYTNALGLRNMNQIRRESPTQVEFVRFRS